MPEGFPGLQFVTSGSFQRAVQTEAEYDLVIGTEKEVGLLATNIVCAEDALLSWIRLQWSVYGTDEKVAFEWFIIKCQSSDGIQDLSDATVVEDLQREKRIFGRGVIMEPISTYGRPKVITNEFYNVKLLRGEELRLVLNPLITNTAGHVKGWSVLEWRQVGA